MWIIFVPGDRSRDTAHAQWPFQVKVMWSDWVTHNSGTDNCRMLKSGMCVIAFDYFVLRLRRTLVRTFTLRMSVGHVSSGFVKWDIPSLSGRPISKDTGSFVCHITSRLLQLCPGVCTKEGHWEVKTGSERSSASDHRNAETRAWFFTAVAWWPALGDYSTAGAVQACCDCSSVTQVPPRYLADSCVPVSEVSGCQSPFGQTSKIECSAVSSQHFWHPGFLSRRYDDLELTAWFVAWSGHRV